MKAELRAVRGFGAPVAGEALVLDAAFSARYDLNLRTGRISRAGHPQRGESIAGRVLVIRSVQGGTAGGWAFMAMRERGVGPVGLVCCHANPVLVQGAVSADLPILDGLDEAEIDLVETGDHVTLLPERRSLLVWSVRGGLDRVTVQEAYRGIAGGSRPNHVTVDLGAVRQNCLHAASIGAASGLKVIAALKADAYGFGLLPVAQACLGAGADAVGVGDFESVALLREGNVSAPVMVYPGPRLTLEWRDRLREFGRVSVVLGAHDAARAAVDPLFDGLDVVVKVDIGLNRFGVRPESAAQAVLDIERAGRARVVGVLAHLAAGELDPPAVHELQLARFGHALDSLEARGALPALRAAVSTATMACLAPMKLDPRMTHVDPGRLLLGLQARGAEGPAWRPALVEVASQLAEVKDSIGAATKVGVVPIGRRDGIDVLNAGVALTKGRRVAVAATYIEHTVLDLGDSPDSTVGDPVIFLGSQDEESITLADAIANVPRTKPVDVLLRLSVPRRYLMPADG